MNHNKASRGPSRAPGKGRGRRQLQAGFEGRKWTLGEIQEWFAAKVDDTWFEADPQVLADDEEIQVIGTLADPQGEYATPVDYESACAASMAEFRETSREARIGIAEKAEATWGRRVSWGVRCGERQVLFTHATAPVMTRLRLAERTVLDTLVAANVARSRSDALAWCVNQIAERDADWLEQLRQALADVDRVRDRGTAAAATASSNPTDSSTK